MPHALLLSPDDQAVSAITGVLEELSVTCERPLDGVSAAQKLNSQSFDLVLVDCENLPAAKLIFDVCRRGKNGNNPVPIAIVDGRAGLPTAFRLGAELILTKPVSKDQARTTIRSAVGRVRKDVATSEIVPAQPASADTSTAGMKDEHAQAAAAGASTHLTSFADPTPAFVPAAVSSSPSTATLSAPTLAPKMPSAMEEFAPSSSAPSAPVSAKPKLPAIPSDDPVLADLERADAEESEKQSAGRVQAVPARPATESEAPILSSYQGRQKPRGALVALLVLVITAGGLYGAWMYQPGFRTLAQPQIDRLLALAGKAAPETQSPSPSKPSAQAAPAAAPVPAPAPAPPPTAEPVKTESTAPESATSSTPGSPAGLPKASSPTSATVQPPTSQGTAAVPPAPVPTATVAPVVSKPEAVKTSVSKPAKLKKAAVAAVPPPDAPLPGENGAIILSSKGAEKRLAHSVPPKSPVGADGTVVLKEVVDENGNVTGVRLVEGNAALATAAMQAVKQWRYRPYVRDGKAQPFQTVVIIDFQKP